jgi:hypothetical protein
MRWPFILVVVAACIGIVTAAAQVSNTPGPKIFGIGFPGTDKGYMMKVFNHLGHRAANEPLGGEANKVIMEYLGNINTDAEVSEWLTEHTKQDLEIHFLSTSQFAPIAPLVIKAFPGSIYFYQMQHPVQWAESLYDLLRSSADNFPELVSTLFAQIADSETFPEREKTRDVENKMDAMRTVGFPVWSFRSMAKFYAAQAKSVLQQVPAGKLFVSETEELASATNIRRIAQFLQWHSNVTTRKPRGGAGAAVHEIAPPRHDAPATDSRKKLGMFKSLSREYVAHVVEETVCAELQGLFDRHVTSFGAQPSWCVPPPEPAPPSWFQRGASAHVGRSRFREARDGCCYAHVPGRFGRKTIAGLQPRTMPKRGGVHWNV